MFTRFCTLCILLAAVPAILSQTEKLGAVQYTPIPGWTKTVKVENVVAFSTVDQSTGHFCIVTLYGMTPGTGNGKNDFTREWNNLVMKPFGAGANPSTDTETVDGWTLVAGGAPIDFQGTKAFAFLTVISGFGRTVSVLGVLNNDSYLTPLQAFVEKLDIEKTVAAAVSPPATSNPALQYDSGGHLLIPPPTRQLTLADIAGQWGESDGINVRYVYRDSGNYAGTDSLHYKSKMTFTADGGYYNDFYAIQNGKMIKDKATGTISISGRVLSVRQKGLAKYVIRGWLELPDMTILEVCGPWYDDDVIPQAIFDNPAQGANLDKKWVRKK